MWIVSTRDFGMEPISFQEAIQIGTMSDGWLAVPLEIPHIKQIHLNTYIDEISLAISTDSLDIIRGSIKRLFEFLWRNFDTGFTHNDLEKIVWNLDKFLSSYIVPVDIVDYNSKIALIDETTWPTDAFKDLALQMLTEMIAIIVAKQNEEAIQKALAGERWQKLVIVVNQTSTSGDTWPAWWAWIHKKPFCMNVIWFPANEATFGQQWQMIWLDDNIFSIAMHESFNPIQQAMKDWNTPEFKQKLKEIIQDQFKDLIEKYGFEIEVKAGSFNSVNIWRIYWQSVYHTVAYAIAEAKWLVVADWINEVIPSGNFGHTYALIQAKKMWLNISNIIVSSNENQAVYDLIEHGRYRHRWEDEKIDCPSVSMIIAYGSNIERLFTFFYGDEITKNFMEKLNKWEEIILTPEQHQKLKDFWLKWYKVSTEQELLTIRQVWIEKWRLICPHTANAYFSANQYKQENPDDKKYMLVSETANPWKFVAAIAAALTCDDPTQIKDLYFQYRKKETSKEWVFELMQIIKAAYIEQGRVFDENDIPQDLREIYTKWFDMPEVVSANDFQAETLKAVKQYAPNFRKQIDDLIKKYS